MDLLADVFVFVLAEPLKVGLGLRFDFAAQIHRTTQIAVDDVVFFVDVSRSGRICNRVGK